MSINQLRHCYCGCRDYLPTDVPSPLKKQLHLLKEVLSWQGVWQHCMSEYCKPPGVRFNKICVLGLRNK